MTGKGYNLHQRVSDEDRIRSSLLLSHRHRQWGHDCPAVDLDFVMAEYNHGVTVAIVDYKHHGESVQHTNARSYAVLGDLYDRHGRQHPLFVARFWPDTWAFKVRPMNERATQVVGRLSWHPFTEQEYVLLLYRLRKDALTEGDRRYIERLNDILPPLEAGDEAA